MVEYSACAPRLCYVSVNCRFHDTSNTLGLVHPFYSFFLQKKKESWLSHYKLKY
jgi:hypothetical protein